MASTPVLLSTPRAAQLSGSGQAKPTNAAEAAQQFEALLIAQMLESAHESSKGGVLDSGDSEGDTMFGFATQQFSQVLASNGGLGLSKLILKELNQT